MTIQSITLQPGDTLTVQVPATVIVPPPPPPPPVLTSPGPVTDLRLVSASESSIALVFTEVSGGDGLPANYDLRYSPTPLSWSLATGILVTGSTIGNQRTVVISGLTPATSYQFQIVAYRGTLNLNAVFGTLSNILSVATLGVVVPPPPPPPSVDNEPVMNLLAGDSLIYQDSMDQYTTPQAMDTWPGLSLHPFYPNSVNYAVIPGRGNSGKALRLVYVNGGGERFIWKTNPENRQWYSPLNSAIVLSYWSRISKNGGVGGGPGFGSTAVGMKWMEMWNLNENARTQFSVTAGNATTGPLWHVNPASRNPVGYQPVGPYWNQVNNNQWHRVTYLYQPASSAGASDGIARMWIDGVKIVDVSAPAAGITPFTGTKPWCTLAEVRTLDIAPVGMINLGEYMNGVRGDGVTDLPMAIDFDDLTWWRLGARL